MVQALDAAAAVCIIKNWIRQRYALLSMPFVSHTNLNSDEKNNNGNGIERIESLKFHLDLNASSTLGDALSDVVIVTGRLIARRYIQ